MLEKMTQLSLIGWLFKLPFRAFGALILFVFFIIFQITMGLYRTYGEPAHLNRGLSIEAKFRSDRGTAIAYMKRDVPGCLEKIWDREFGQKPSAEVVVAFYAAEIDRHLKTPLQIPKKRARDGYLSPKLLEMRIMELAPFPVEANGSMTLSTERRKSVNLDLFRCVKTMFPEPDDVFGNR